MTTFDRMLRTLSEGLLATGLVTPPQWSGLLLHAGGFPALPAQRVFLEYRLGSELVLEGYGHGYDPAALRARLRSDADFPAVQLLRDAMARDPFAQDRRRYLDVEADTDPTWVEYDHVDGIFSDAPGVFFAFPARFRGIPDRLRARSLESRLDPLLRRPEGDEVSFWDVLDLLEESAPEGLPIGLYRLGLCAGRRGDWVRIVLNNLSRHALNPLDGIPAIRPDPDPIGWVVDHLGALGDVDPQIAASVTIVGGAVEGIDLECPFFHRIADDDERSTRAAAFCRQLAGRGLVDPSVADTLARAAVVHLRSPDEAVRGLLLLNHVKFGVAGSTRGRVKAYFELLARADA